MKKFMKLNMKKIISVAVALVILASVCIAGTMTSNASGTGAGLAEWALNAYYSHWRYVYGGSSAGAVDCSGLIYSYCGGARTNLEMSASDIGYVSSGVPRIHGLGLHQPGHYGVYIGDGMAVDARNESSGVCYQSVATKSWVEWFKVGACNYITNGWEQFNGQYYYYEDGEYVVNTSREIGGVTYNFGSNGASDKTPDDMNAVANSGGGVAKKKSAPKSTTSDTSVAEVKNEAAQSTQQESEPATEKATEEEKSTSLKLGSSGDDVTKLQQRLAELGYYTGEITGYYGEATEKAYKKFQKAAGLSTDGIAGEDERGVLFSDAAPSAVTEDIDKSEKETEPENDGTYHLGMQSDDVALIQQTLLDLKYFYGEVTGYYGELTEQAVKDFQYINGLDVTGIVDEATYALLFSGTVPENTVPETEPETEPETAEPVEQVADAPAAVETPAQVSPAPQPTSNVAEENLAVVHKVVLKTNRLTKKALTAFDNDETANITAENNNSNFLIWMLIVLGLAAVVTGVMFVLNKRNAAYTGSRVKGRKKTDVPVRYW